MTLWTPEPFEADDGTVPFERFADGLSDFKFNALDMAIIHVLAVRGLDLARTEWLKPLGSGLHEFRIRHTPAEISKIFGTEITDPETGRPEKILLRVFVHFHGQKVILLLGGYDKAKAPKPRRQQREIAQALRLLDQFKERQRRERRS